MLQDLPPAAPGERHIFIVRLWWEADAVQPPGRWRLTIEHLSSEEAGMFRRPMHSLHEIASCIQEVLQQLPGHNLSREHPPS